MSGLSWFLFGTLFGWLLANVIRISTGTIQVNIDDNILEKLIEAYEIRHNNN